MNLLLKALTENEVISKCFGTPSNRATELDKRNYQQVSGTADELIAFSSNIWLVKQFGVDEYLVHKGDWKKTFFPEADLTCIEVKVPTVEEITQNLLDSLTSSEAPR